MDTVFYYMEMRKMKITIKDVDEVLYYHKLDNGLELFMIPKTVNNIYVTFNTVWFSL